jgi:SAM-dependent methyltransferase
MSPIIADLRKAGAGGLSPGASTQGDLWGARARDWANFNEPAWQPVFRAVMQLAEPTSGKLLLDIGCGAGGALVVAHRHGAEVAGVDASANLVVIARDRLPEATIKIGDMEALPFDDASFDIVTGINSFQFAGDLTSALAEAKRVLRRKGTLIVLVWGRPEECELVTGTVSAVFALLPQNRSRDPAPRLLDQPGPLEAAMREAGLEPTAAGELSAVLMVPDANAAIRAVLSASARAIRHVGDDMVAQIIRATLPRFTQADGSVAWKNCFRWVRATRA